MPRRSVSFASFFFQTSTSSLSLFLRHQTTHQVLTPEEFVRAGDFLVRTCPTWSWEAGDASKRRPYLPKEKQYLITRGVPSRRRASAVEGYGGGGEGGEGEEEEEENEEGWVAPPPANDDGGAVEAAVDVVDDDDDDEKKKDEEAEEKGTTNDDDIPDLEDLELVDEEDIDEAALPPASVAASAAARAAKRARANAGEESVVRVRTYDLSISYDKYYQVPRFWLAGFDEFRRPLSNEALLEDVAAEHARKTVTVEPHPHRSSPPRSSDSNSFSSNSSIRVASIHPCRHASVMKKLANMGAGGFGGEATATASSSSSLLPPPSSSSASSFDPEAYLVLFLKFISSVIPTIEYDFTMHAPLGGGGGGGGSSGVG